MYPSSEFGRHYVPKGTLVAEAGRSWGTATPEQRAWRQTNRYYGPGAYSAGRNWRKFSQSVGLAGVGKKLLHSAANTAIGLMGQGAYGNSLVAGGEPTPEVPMVVSDADETGMITVSRREYLQDVFAPAAGVAFSIEDFPLNPGLEMTFPWLSQIAQNYEEYQLDQLIFHFRSTVTDIGTTSNGQCGTVIMATNYNAAAPVFTDKGQMQAYDGAMSCKTTESMTHGVECDVTKLAGSDAHYVRVGAAPAGQDIKTYDHGIFQLAIANSPASFAGNSIGELWVSYTVRLAKPKFSVARGLGINRDLFVTNSATLTASQPMGTSAALLSGQQNNIGCTLDLSVANRVRITVPPEFNGTLEIVYMAEGAGASGDPFTAPAVAGNVVLISDIYGGAGSSATAGVTPSSYAWARQSGGSGGASINCFIFVAHVRVTNSTGGVANTFDINTTFTSGAVQASLDLHEYNAGFSSRALGIGPASARSDAPILINASGVQVIPA